MAASYIRRVPRYSVPLPDHQPRLNLLLVTLILRYLPSCVGFPSILILTSILYRLTLKLADPLDIFVYLSLIAIGTLLYLSYLKRLDDTLE
jgi:hypothetical protein